MKLYMILQKPNGIIGRIAASSPKEAIKIFCQKNPEWATPEKLKAKKDPVKR